MWPYMSGPWSNLCTQTKVTESFLLFKVENIFIISFFSLPPLPFLHHCYWKYLFHRIHYSAAVLCFGRVQRSTVQKFQIKVSVYEIGLFAIKFVKSPKWSRNFVTIFFYLSITIKPILLFNIYILSIILSTILLDTEYLSCLLKYIYHAVFALS